jgi:hypothetical protein
MTRRFDWHNVVQHIVTYVKNDISVQIGAAIVGVGIIAGSAYYGHRWWIDQREMSAQGAFSEIFDNYRQLVERAAGKDGASPEVLEQWNQLSLDLEYHMSAHRRSSLAPFFVALQSHVARAQRDDHAAVGHMREAVRMLGVGNPYYGVYEVALSLMLLDGDVEQVAEGIAKLDRLVADESSSAHDMALYYRGLYANSVGNREQAVTLWQRLVALPKPADGGQSPWIRVAEKRLSECAQPSAV